LKVIVTEIIPGARVSFT